MFPNALFVTDWTLDEPHRVWHTIMGRSMLRENEATVGQMFSDAGYETGMFGKWHLGDNYGMSIPVYDPAHGRVPPQ